MRESFEMNSKSDNQSSASLKHLPKLEYIADQPLHRAVSSSNASENIMTQTEQYKGFSDELDENKAKTLHKIGQLAKRNPFVPIGVLVTVGVLGRGLFAMKSKDQGKSQRMMRYRVAAQGFTVIALVIGTVAAQFVYKPDSIEKKIH